jgi:hypothetical protein
MVANTWNSALPNARTISKPIPLLEPVTITFLALYGL